MRLSECWLRLCSDRHNFSISLLRSKDKSPKKSIATKFEDVAVIVVGDVLVAAGAVLVDDEDDDEVRVKLNSSDLTLGLHCISKKPWPNFLSNSKAFIRERRIFYIYRGNVNSKA